LPSGSTLVDAVRVYLASYKSGITSSPTIPDAIAEYLTARESSGCRKKTLESYAGLLRRLPREGKVNQMARAGLLLALDGLLPRNRNNHIACWSGFFRWAMRRGYALSNPCAEIDHVRIDAKPITIYTPSEIERVMREAEKTGDSRLVSMLAISAFAGVRSSGLLRLGSDSVRLDEKIIMVGGAADKLRLGYCHECSENLLEWLRLYPFTPYHVTPSFWSNRLQSVFRSAGIEPKPNALRHSAATYMMAKTHNASYVAAQLGQWGMASLLEHYRRAVTPSDAAAYWAILPQSYRTQNPRSRKPLQPSA
jgi:integrase